MHQSGCRQGAADGGRLQVLTAQLLWPLETRRGLLRARWCQVGRWRVAENAWLDRALLLAVLLAEQLRLQFIHCHGPLQQQSSTFSNAEL